MDYIVSLPQTAETYTAIVTAIVMIIDLVFKKVYFVPFCEVSKVEQVWQLILQVYHARGPLSTSVTRALQEYSQWLTLSFLDRGLWLNDNL
jgi:hypothetical protein